jgi:hypothetical protein
MVPPGLSNVVAIAAGEYHSLAIKSDGTIVGWGDNLGAESPPDGLGNVVYAAGGCDFSVALVADLRVLSITCGGRGPQLRFQSFAGRQYAAEYSAQAHPASWLPVTGGTVPGTGAVATITDTNSFAPARRFYRLRQF